MVDEQMQDTVTIPREVYKDLLESRDWLNCLESAGVDNWGGIDFARELQEELIKERGVGDE